MAKWIWAGAVVVLAASGGYAAGKQAKAPKAFVIAEVNVTDPEAYKVYAPMAAKAVAAHGGTYLVRGGRVEPLEGPPPAPRYAIVAFDSLDKAKAFHASAQYQEAAKIRRAASQSRFWVVEGIAAPAMR
jgi:uncharacterized protein (DUF1330 family)